MEVIRQLTIGLVRLLSRLLLKVKTAGFERIPLDGATIVAINHINFIEGPLLYVTWPREIIGLGKAELWSNPIQRLIVASLRLIPIRRGELDLNAIRLSVRALKEGRVLGLAPEGTRSHHGHLQPGRPGLVMLTLRAPEAPIVPVAIYGQEKYRQNLRRLRRTEVNMVVGQLFWLEPGEGRVTHEMRQQMTDEVMMQIAALLPPEYRGVYSNLASATEHYLRFPPGTESNLQHVLRSSRPASGAVEHTPRPASAEETHAQGQEGS